MLLLSAGMRTLSAFAAYPPLYCRPRHLINTLFAMQRPGGPRINHPQQQHWWSHTHPHQYCRKEGQWDTPHTVQ